MHHFELLKFENFGIGCLVSVSLPHGPYPWFTNNIVFPTLKWFLDVSLIEQASEHLQSSGFGSFDVELANDNLCGQNNVDGGFHG